MVKLKPIKAYEPTAEDERREWTGEGAKKPLPPVMGSAGIPKRATVVFGKKR